MEEASGFPTTPPGERPPATGTARVIAGPVPEGATSVEAILDDGTTIEAETIEAFDLTWFWLERERDKHAGLITASDADGNVVQERVRGRVQE